MLSRSNITCQSQKVLVWLGFLGKRTQCYPKTLLSIDCTRPYVDAALITDVVLLIIIIEINRICDLILTFDFIQKYSETLISLYSIFGKRFQRCFRRHVKSPGCYEVRGNRQAVEAVSEATGGLNNNFRH